MLKVSKNSNMGLLITLVFVLPIWMVIGIALYFNIPFKEEHLTVYFTALIPFSYLTSKKVASSSFYQKMRKFSVNKMLIGLFIIVFITAALAVFVSTLMYSMPQWFSIGLSLLLLAVGFFMWLVDELSPRD